MNRMFDEFSFTWFSVDIFCFQVSRLHNWDNFHIIAISNYSFLLWKYSDMKPSQSYLPFPLKTSKPWAQRWLGCCWRGGRRGSPEVLWWWWIILLIVGMIMIEKVVMNFMIIVMKKTMVMIMFKKIMVVMFTKSSPNFSLIGGCRVRQNWGFVAKSTCGCFF